MKTTSKIYPLKAFKKNKIIPKVKENGLGNMANYDKKKQCSLTHHKKNKNDPNENNASMVSILCSYYSCGGPHDMNFLEMRFR